METHSSHRSLALGFLGYFGLLVLGVAIVLGVQHLGYAWGFVVATSDAASTKPASNVDVEKNEKSTKKGNILRSVAVDRIENLRFFFRLLSFFSAISISARELAE